MGPTYTIDHSVVQPNQITQDEKKVSPTENSITKENTTIPLMSKKKKQKMIIITVVSTLAVVIIALVLFLIFGVNRKCQETLVVKSDSYCNYILKSQWRTITVNEGFCNEMTSDLVISGYSCLEELIIKKDSLKNLNVLKISDNPVLQKIETGDGEYDRSVDKVFKAPFLSVKTVIIESRMIDD